MKAKTKPMKRNRNKASLRAIAGKPPTSRQVRSEHPGADEDTPKPRNAAKGRICAFGETGEEIERLRTAAENLANAMNATAEAVKTYNTKPWEKLAEAELDAVAEAERIVMDSLVKTACAASATLRDFLAEVAVRSAQLPITETSALVSTVGNLCDTHARSFSWVCERISRLAAQAGKGGAK